jgi:hypothetical protein
MMSALAIVARNGNVPAVLTEDDRITLPWPERARALKIIDQATLQLAVDERAGVKALIDQGHERHDPICAKTHEAWQEATTQRKIDLDPLGDAWDTYNQEIIAWDQECKRREAAAQRQREIEQQRQALEEREAEIEHAEATGATVNEVKAIVERPIVTPVMPAAAPPPKAIGIQKVRENWQGEITDKRPLVEYIVKTKRWELLGLLTADTTAVRDMARVVKSAGSIPGVKFWDAGAVASSPRRS